MPSGRKPIPSGLKSGKVRKSRQNTEEPKPIAGVPPCPTYLDDVAKAKWDEMIRTLGQLGILSQSDTDAIATYCEVWSRYRQCQEALKTEPLVVTSKSGLLLNNPYVNIANQCIKQLERMQTSFGLTPSARTKVKAEKPETDELTDFLKSKMA